jgi:recombination protein RecR
MTPLMTALDRTAQDIRICDVCGNLDLTDPCRTCRDMKRDGGIICVVSGVADLWAIERTGAFRGKYHILGGVLSALDGITPDDLRVEQLLGRLKKGGVNEIILALSATVDGQATAHYLTDRLLDTVASVKITRLAHGVPVGGELDYLDDGTIATALKSRASF